MVSARSRSVIECSPLHAPLVADADVWNTTWCTVYCLVLSLMLKVLSVSCVKYDNELFVGTYQGTVRSLPE